MVDARELAKGFSEDTTLADGSTVRALNEAGLRRVATDSGMRPWGAQRAALQAGVWPLRYLRNIGTHTVEDQLTLLTSRVALVGLGGLGGHLLEILARQGVGRIRAADGDVFEEHNLNRQLLATTGTVGNPKAEAAKARVAEINPACELEASQDFLTEATLPGFLTDSALVLDALGGLKDRQTLQRAAAAAGLPLVTGAMAGTTGYVAVVRPGAAGPADFLGQGQAAEDTLGTPPASVALVASLMAHEATRLLTTGDSPLTGAMLLIDMNAASFERVVL